jgi:hypothetical protein
MKSAYHILIISAAIGLVYLWLRIPALSSFSLQLFAITILSYFVIKKIHKAKIWQLLPAHASVEMAIVTIAFLLLIGATGNLHSVLFALSFVHLFLLAFKTDVVTACVATIEIVLFHFALTADPSLSELSFLLSLPLVMAFFLVIKQQYARIFWQQQQLAREEKQLAETKQLDQQLQNFLSGFLEEKLNKLQRMSFFPAENQQQMQAEMAEVAALTDELIAETKDKQQQITSETTVTITTALDQDGNVITSDAITDVDIFTISPAPTEETTNPDSSTQNDITESSNVT